MKNKKICLILIIILTINLLASFVYASGISQDKEKLEETNEKIDSLKNQINNNKNETNKVTSEIKSLDKKIDKVEQELEQVQNELSELNKDIENTKAELSEAENNINDKQDTLESRLRVMYKNGTIGYLEVLLSSERISDFLTRLDLVQSIIDYDVNLLKYMKEQRQIIEEKKDKLITQQSSLSLAKQEVNKKKNELVSANRQKEIRMSQLKKDRVKMEKQYDQLNDLAKKIEEEIRKKQLAAKYAGGDMTWPAPGYYRITSPFGNRIHPIFKVKKLHTGIDIGAPYGAKIVAANSGVVQYSGWLGGYGKVVIIDHGGGITTLYAHNSRLLVSAGQKVSKGQAVSKAGSTGYSTGAHLHFEVRKNGVYTNPVPWVTSN